MKQARSIISHIGKNPLFNNLQKTQSYKKLISFMPVNIKDGIFYMYNKNNTLFMAFKHQGYWMEFNNFQRKYQMEYKQNYIKSTLSQLIKLDPTCKCIKAENVKFFYIDTSKLDANDDNDDAMPYYLERSNGEFKNSIKKEKLHKLFEDIREIICSQKH